MVHTHEIRHGPYSWNKAWSILMKQGRSIHFSAHTFHTCTAHAPRMLTTGPMRRSMEISTHVFMACAWTCQHIGLHTFVSVRMWVYLHLSPRLCTCLFTCLRTSVHMSVHISMHISIQIAMHMCFVRTIHVCAHVHAHVRVLTEHQWFGSSTSS